MRTILQLMNHLNMQDYTLMELCRCGLMPKIHFIYDDYTVTPSVSRE